MSENNAHTPGPWYVSDLYIVQRDGMQEYAICRMLTAWDTSERNANAALIARAPELEAENKRLRELLSEVTEHLERNYKRGYDFNAAELIKEAKTALNK